MGHRYRITPSPQSRLGSCIIDRRTGSVVRVTGDLPQTLLTSRWQSYQPLVAAGARLRVEQVPDRIAQIIGPVIGPATQATSRATRASVIIPARNPDITALTRLVADLVTRPWVAEIIVVDDGSDPPLRLNDVCVLNTNAHTTASLGPAAARNLGAKRATQAILVFVDADIDTIDAHFEELLLLLEEPALACVAPRILEPGHPSPLDLGPEGTLVDGRHLNHLPSAVLAIRQNAFWAAGGFRADLRLGEDVELVARLRRMGAWALYDSESKAMHQPQQLTTRLRKTIGYGYSIGPLRRLVPEARFLPAAIDLPALLLTLVAPVPVALAEALLLLGRLGRAHTHGQRTKLLVLLADDRLANATALATREFGVPLIVASILSRTARRLLAGAVIQRVLRFGPTQVAYDVTYSIGLYLSLILEW